MKTWHKYGLAVTGLLALASWIIAATYWGKLPAVIPTHFGVNGMADDWQNKSIFWAFLLPAIQTLMVAMFGFLYWKPQYSDMPTTMWLMAMEDKVKEHAFDLIRTMLVGTGLWVGVLLTYMVYAMNVSALDKSLGMNPWLLLAFVSGMILWLILWTIKVYRATKEAISKRK